MKWYILSYDIRDPKRLQRTHYYLKKEAIALQKSVFLVPSNHVNEAKAIIQQYTRDNEDDVRLYPITHPNAIWTAGCQAEALKPLGIKPAKSLASGDSFVKKLFKGFLKKEKASEKA